MILSSQLLSLFGFLLLVVSAVVPVAAADDNEGKASFGYVGNWNVLYAQCASAGEVSNHCVHVVSNATPSDILFNAFRDADPTVRSSSAPYRYLDERVPGPTINVTSGERIKVNLQNSMVST